MILVSLFGAYRWLRGFGDRTVTVCVVSDPEYRIAYGEQAGDTATRLLARFAEINRHFRGAGVQWQAISGGDAYPPETRGGLEERREMMAQSAQCKADVILGFTGRTSAAAVSVAPFAHAILVGERNADSETYNSMVAARALATLFGSGDDPYSIVAIAAPQQAGIFSDATRRLISRLRSYDFGRGIGALRGKWEIRAADALTESLAGKVSHPNAEAERILGRTFAGVGQLADAVRHFGEAVRRDPRDGNLRMELAIALHREAEDDAAIVELREAALLDPADPQPYALLGAIYLSQQRPYLAVDALRAAIRLDPTTADYHAALGRVLEQQVGQITQARAAFDTALRLDPRQQLALMAGSQAVGIEDWLLNSIAKAREATRKAPGSVDAAFQLASAELAAGRLDSAGDGFRQILARQPDHGPAHIGLAHVHYQRGNLAAADAELRDARAAGADVPSDFANEIARKLGKQ